MAESAMINTEESIMATFDFLSPENMEDEDSLSDGENDENQGDDDDRVLVAKRPKTKVILKVIFNTIDNNG